MIKLLIHWVLSALALLIIAQFVPGFQVQGLEPALIAALVIGLLNGTLGLLLKIITFPISILTLGLFLLVINALMIRLAAHIVTGFVGSRGALGARYGDPFGCEKGLVEQLHCAAGINLNSGLDSC